MTSQLHAPTFSNRHSLARRSREPWSSLKGVQEEKIPDPAAIRVTSSEQLTIQIMKKPLRFLHIAALCLPEPVATPFCNHLYCVYLIDAIRPPFSTKRHNFKLSVTTGKNKNYMVSHRDRHDMSIVIVAPCISWNYFNYQPTNALT